MVGNQAYASAPLTNPRDDAHDVRLGLERLGFDVFGGVDFNLAALEERFTQFQREVADAEVVVLYFSGHGVQIEGRNHFVPVDVGLDGLLSASRSLDVQALVETSPTERTCLMFLDACRDNPHFSAVQSRRRKGRSGWSVRRHRRPDALSVWRGLAPVEVSTTGQTFVAFAAAPGKYAYGAGDRRNSHFTEALLTHLDTSGLSLDSLMNRVRDQVRASTGGRQDPWSQTNLRGEHYLQPPPRAPMVVMTVLGMLSGLLVSPWMFAADGDFQKGLNGWGGAVFGLAIAYGIWRWGQRSTVAAVAAFVIVTLAFWLGFEFLERIGTFKDKSNIFDTPSLWTNGKSMRDLIGAVVAGGIAAIGTIGAAAVSTPVLRDLRSLGILVLAGVFVGVVLRGVNAVNSLNLGDGFDRARRVLSRYGLARHARLRRLAQPRANTFRRRRSVIARRSGAAIIGRRPDAAAKRDGTWFLTIHLSFPSVSDGTRESACGSEDPLRSAGGDLRTRLVGSGDCRVDPD